LVGGSNPSAGTSSSLSSPQPFPADGATPCHHAAHKIAALLLIEPVVQGPALRHRIVPGLVLLLRQLMAILALGIALLVVPALLILLLALLQILAALLRPSDIAPQMRAVRHGTLLSG
jgi:hypothetical protein